MPPLPMPRRFRRPLLLPPGWVALGFLLLLGCGLLQAHWRQLRPANLVQFTMPPLKANTALVNFYRTMRRDTAEYSPFLDAEDKHASAKINRMRPWHTIDFGGQPLADFFSSQAIEDAVRLINADSSHAGGVRIRFRASATYANLVKVLDIMDYTGQKKYWLDNRHRFATFYAITNRELPRNPEAVSFYCGYHAVPPPPPDSWKRWLNVWQQWLTALQLPAWRLPWLLLLALGVLGVRKVRGAS